MTDGNRAVPRRVAAPVPSLLNVVPPPDPATARALRQPPRQRRARERVEAILDAAAEVFEEVGYEKATTNEIVRRAGVSPGTLYHWFPDKGALADGLVERYLDALMGFYGPLLDNDPDEPVSHMIRRVLRELARFVTGQGALAALLSSVLSPMTTSDAGRRLEENLATQVRALLELRVPDLMPTERERVTAVVLRVVLTLLTTLPTVPEADREATAEDFSDLLVAYVNAKFPAADAPVWAEDDPPVRPYRPAPQVVVDPTTGER